MTIWRHIDRARLIGAAKDVASSLALGSVAVAIVIALRTCGGSR